MNSERKIIFLAFSMMLLNMIDFMLVMPLAPYFVKELHVSVSLIGTIVGAYTLCAGFSSLLFSKIVSRITRKKAIIYSLLGLAIATALTSLAWNESSLIMFRVVAGAFGGPVASLATIIITDNIPVAKRGKAMGILMSSFSISSAVAIPLEIFVAVHTSWHFAFIIISLLIIAVLLLVVFKYEPFKQIIASEQSAISKALLKNKAAWSAFIAIGITMATLFALIPNLSNFFVMNRGLAIGDLSYMYLCGGIASIIGAILGGRLIDKIGPIPICFLGSGFVIVALITQINFDIIPIFLFFMLMMGGASLRMTSVMTQISEIPEPEQRGAFMSLQNTVRNFMMAMGSGLSGLFLSQSSNGHLQGMGHIAILAAIGSLFIPFIMFYIAAFLRKRGTAY